MGIKLDLEPQDLDVVTKALAQQPWMHVNHIMQKIIQQANDISVQSMRVPEPDAKLENPDVNRH